MLPKKNRVDKKEIEKIFKEGRFVNSANLSLKFIIGVGERKISFIVPKNVAKLSVNRNLLRRHGYSALEKYISRFPNGLVGVFVFKKYQDDILIIENEIKKIFSKIN